MKDDYGDTNGPLASTIVAAFWTIVGGIVIIELIRLIVWLIKLL
jgi:hypothetical protein